MRTFSTQTHLTYKRLKYYIQYDLEYTVVRETHSVFVILKFTT